MYYSELSLLEKHEVSLPELVKSGSGNIFGRVFFKPQVLVLKRSFLGFLRVESHEGGLGGGYLKNPPQNTTNFLIVTAGTPSHLI